MKKYIFLTSLIFSVISCKNEVKKQQDLPENLEIEKPENTNTTTSDLYLKDFDWSKIPNSSSEIGVFPYITAPEGFSVRDEYGEVSKNGMTKYSDFSQLIMFNGTSFYNAEGKTSELVFIMNDRKTAFNQFKFDKSVDNYLNSIGAIALFKGQIPREKINELNKTDEYTVHKYITGDPYNSAPVRHYALNHNNGKIMFQVWSNSSTGEIGIVELEGFKQTIKAPTASEMQKEIEAQGKAILNINFDTDKATLKADGQKIVDEIYILLTNNTNLKLSIEGHTDNTGSAARNKQLSSDRANTVMYALAGKGIDIKRLKASGFGSEKPIAANDSEDNKAKNRRVELVKF